MHKLILHQIILPSYYYSSICSSTNITPTNNTPTNVTPINVVHLLISYLSILYPLIMQQLTFQYLPNYLWIINNIIQYNWSNPPGNPSLPVVRESLVFFSLFVCLSHRMFVCYIYATPFRLQLQLYIFSLYQFCFVKDKSSYPDLYHSTQHLYIHHPSLV